MLKIRIKASQISNLTDARYFAAVGAEWLGFCLDPINENFVPYQKLLGIKEWVEGPLIVGEFSLQSTEEILSMAKEINLDAIQVSPFFPISQLSALTELPTIQEVIITKDFTIDALKEFVALRKDHVQHFLFDFARNGISFNDLEKGWHGIRVDSFSELLEELPTSIIDLSFDYEKLASVAASIPLLAMSIKGGDEEKVGFKSYDELDVLFDLLEED